MGTACVVSPDTTVTVIVPLQHTRNMAKNTADRITDILHSMDSIDLLNVIRRIQERIGDRELLAVLESEASAKSSFDPSEIEDWASECTDMDEMEWYNCASTDSYGSYIDPGEHACDVILDNLRDSFENDLKQMVLSGDKQKASEFLIAIAAGLRRSNGILAEEAGDFISDFADHLEECAEREDFKDVFYW